MICTSFKFISREIMTDSIGVQKQVEKISPEIPIIKIEDIYESEYYRANELGYKPTLRLRISAINFNNEQELIYNNKNYTILRTQNIRTDELILICEEKIINV